MRRFADRSQVEIRHACYIEADAELAGSCAGAQVETTEHIDPHCLGEVEQAVFGTLRPRLVLITTPNAESNPMHGLRPGQRRHPDHRFEWDRARFRAWCRRIARRHGYRTTFHDIGKCDRELGASTQMARFEHLVTASASNSMRSNAA